MRTPALLGALLLAVSFQAGSAPVAKGPSAPRSMPACWRPAAGAEIPEPHDIRSSDGLLQVALTIRSSPDGNGHTRYCYVDEHGNQAPTLRVKPGDTLVIRLTNKISASAGAAAPEASVAKHDPCSGGTMTAASTNLHFHGLHLPPVCHQDETLRTLIQPGDPPFEYRVRIPEDQPPGLYWYHPHVHGFSEEQLLGGASGALIVEGLANAVPRVRGLPDRVFVIRDEWMPTAPPAGKPDPTRPTKQLSVNYVPDAYPQYRTGTIRMKPNQRELWRVVNASADTYLQLSIEIGGKRQNFGVVGLDGVPMHYGEPGAKDYAAENSAVLVPPAGRLELIVTAPPAGGSGRLMTGYVYRGADEDAPPATAASVPPGTRTGQDDVDAARPLFSFVASESASEPVPIAAMPALQVPATVPLSGVRPVRKRTLYFSERLSVPGDPNSPTLFFITEEGHTPAVFDPGRTQPDITVHQGEVEDWIIENRSRESHTFHIHGLNFLVVSARGATGWQEPTERDTVDIPAWSGFGRYPSLTLRMDFRDPGVVGTLPFHCHIAQHLDGGMMGTVRIEPAVAKQ